MFSAPAISQEEDKEETEKENDRLKWQVAICREKSSSIASITIFFASISSVNKSWTSIDNQNHDWYYVTGKISMVQLEIILFVDNLIIDPKRNTNK